MTSPVAATVHTFVKGHGTGNDFLLYADPDGAAPLSTSEVAALADRHTGIGADGVIRAVRSAAITDGAAGAGATGREPAALWFMDYLNADGSVAEMCGNGIRVFVAFLRHAGLLALGDGDTVQVATRAGVLGVRREGAAYAADLGLWSAPGGTEALAQGFDVSVAVAGLDEPRPGLRLDLPNPHTVIALEELEQLEALDLTQAPIVEPAPAHGTNVEFVVPLGEREVDVVDRTGAVIGSKTVGVVRMRVHERGVGETLSCGTGACAAALAVRTWFGAGAPQEWIVQVPGGELRVRMLPEDHVELAGPAELVGEFRTI
ncbi:diaminopimelate epimerase [Occultella glacieicola]|uniref:Diaminopimelate epimerase n=1 Tax=Occultella glacieicola TaxID=2518684 RepID=A0ABY2E1D1_9MICO|nr:diaminopimelate epimerase [Occultella glacieicola]TDE90794.1 diaminopimelate epimerase [Occultella glacieicola]